MKLTCLSRGGGFHFPPCHMLNLCGFRILLDCPVDLSALTIFSPVPTDFYTLLDEETSACSSHDSLDVEPVIRKRQRIEKPLDANSLIHAEPWYKTVKNLYLWNASFIDIVLISSPMGMLGLPFLTGIKDFSAKIYVTEATAKLGQLMMADLVSMHMEFKHIYGPVESGYPQWMKCEELELLPSALREIALGEDGMELGGWMPLYSAADVKDCIQKLQTLKYAEEACYNGTLVIKAFSSGLEIGACNWTINSPKGNIAYISSSIFASGHAMSFDYHALRGKDLILYSDFSSLNVSEGVEDDHNYSTTTTNELLVLRDGKNNWEELTASVESLEEREKLDFVCSCMVDSVKAGGSVLIPINRLGIILQLLEQLSVSLESSNLKVPIYIISSVAEELLAFTNIIPEWLCKQRQEKLFSGEPLFAHVELIRGEKLHVFPAIHSPKLLTSWQEPCIVFSPHWSLRLGPVVHLLQRWCKDPNCLLVLENGLDAEMAIMPFKPMSMKVLQCSFLSGIKLQMVKPLLNILQPKVVLFPEDLKQHISFSDANSFSVVHYSENEILRVPSLKDCLELEIATDLASQFHWRKLKQENMNITRLKGDLVIDHGKHRLRSGNELAVSSAGKPSLHWGSPDLEKLVTVLSKMGINGSVERSMSDAESENVGRVNVHDPSKALIEVGATSTVISAADRSLASHIFEAIGSVLDCT